MNVRKNFVLAFLFLFYIPITICAVSNKPEAKKDSTEAIVFKLVSSDIPLILVPVFINDKGPYDFILDTGASQSMISKELAKELEIKSTESAKGTGAGGEIDVSIGHVKSLAIGKSIINNLEVAIGNSESLESIGIKVSGIIGYNFLKNYRLIIDYPKLMIFLKQ